MSKHTKLKRKMHWHDHYIDTICSQLIPETIVLPDELILQILLRLPVRSLLRFRCVCKSWKTLMSHPRFAKDHIRTSTANPNTPHQQLVSRTSHLSQMVYFSPQSLLQNPTTLVEPHFFMTGVIYSILGSCNGLLCMSNFYQHYVVLVNPSIESNRFYIDVRPQVSDLYYYGFGYDHVNDKYKLLLAETSCYEAITKIYTFGEGSWKVIQNLPCIPFEKLGKFVSGTLNWICNDGSDRWVILSLGMVNETYSEVLLPEWDNDILCNPMLSVLRDCLCVCFLDYKKFHWDVWLMKEYGVQDSWTKLMTIEVNETWNDLRLLSPLNHGLGYRYSIHLLCIFDNGVVVLEVNRKIVLYNMNDCRLDYPSIGGEHGLHDPHIYHESLVSPPC